LIRLNELSPNELSSLRYLKNLFYVRRNSLNNKVISINEHKMWFNINKNKLIIYTIQSNNRIIGYIRYDKINNQNYYLNYMLIREFHGKRIMKQSIISSFKKLKIKQNHNFLFLNAITLLVNIKSTRLLKKLDFRLIETKDSHLLFRKKI